MKSDFWEDSFKKNPQLEEFWKNFLKISEEIK